MNILPFRWLVAHHRWIAHTAHKVTPLALQLQLRVSTDGRLEFFRIANVIVVEVPWSSTDECSPSTCNGKPSDGTRSMNWRATVQIVANSYLPFALAKLITFLASCAFKDGR